MAAALEFLEHGGGVGVVGGFAEGVAVAGDDGVGSEDEGDFLLLCGGVRLLFGELVVGRFCFAAGDGHDVVFGVAGDAFVAFDGHDAEGYEGEFEEFLAPG